MDLENFFDQATNNVSACENTASKISKGNSIDINTTWGEVVNSLAKNDLSAILTTCTYSGSSCSTSDFQPINTIGGTCYTFNKVGSVRMATGSGIRRGLRLDLEEQAQPFSVTSDKGYRVIIHNRDELPRPESDGIAVGFKSSVYIGMRQVTSVDKTIYSKVNPCRKEITNQQLSFPNYDSYSTSLCQSECFFTSVANTCRCKEPSLYTPVSNRYEQLKNCSLPDACCEINTFETVRTSCNCPQKCINVDYALTVSSAGVDSGASVFVYYESLIAETRETMDAFTPWGLLTSIGGNSGLFLGFTLLSMVELLLLVVGLGKDSCCCKRNK